MIRPKTFFIVLISTIFGIHFVLTFTISTPKNFGKTHFVVGMPLEYCDGQESDTNVSYCPVPVHEDGSIKYALFSPDDDIQKTLIEFIDGEQESIHIAVYMFTNDDIAQALIRAHERGVQVEVVTDKSAMGDRFSKVDSLIKKGITVFVFSPKQGSSFSGKLMHNKFVLFKKNSFNKSFTLTGSFNFTKAAETNQENLVVLDVQPVFQQYIKQYDILKSRCSAYCLQPDTKKIVVTQAQQEDVVVKRREKSDTHKKKYLTQLMNTKQIHAMV